MNYQALNRRAAAIGLIALVHAVAGIGCAAKHHSEKSDAPKTMQTAPAPTTQPRPTTRPAAARTGTLYERLGGEEVIRKVVDDFVASAAADPAVNFSRQGHPTPWQANSENVQRLKQHLVQYIATVGDGPTKHQYWGRNMVTAHRGMGITSAEFDALAGHLAAALQANCVPTRESEELLNAIASTKAAIVEVKEEPVAATPVDEVAPAPAEAAPDAASPAPDAETPAPDAATAAPDAATPAPDGAATVPADDAQPQPNAAANADEAPAQDSPGSADSDGPKADDAPATANTSDEYVNDPEL